MVRRQSGSRRGQLRIMWQRHWNLDRHPFDDRSKRFVAIPGHSEAVARLVQVIESAERSAWLVAAPGLGKSTVLARAIEATRSPERRFARVSGPIDGLELFGGLAAGLGARGMKDPNASRSMAWRILGESARLCRWQGLHVVLSVDDDCHVLADRSGRDDLERLDHLDPDPSTRLTVLRVGQPTGSDSSVGERLGALDPAPTPDPLRIVELRRGPARGRRSIRSHLHAPSPDPAPCAFRGSPLEGLTGWRPSRSWPPPLEVWRSSHPRSWKVLLTTAWRPSIRWPPMPEAGQSPVWPAGPGGRYDGGMTW